MKASLSAVFLALCLVSQSAFTDAKVSDVSLEALPSWAQDTLYSGIYLDIDKVMATEKNLTRFQAVELQGYFRQSLEANAKIDKQKAYDEALSKVRQGVFQTRWRPVTFSAEEKAAFIVVLDMDETLLMQWYGSGKEGNADITVGRDVVKTDRSGPYIKFVPDVEKFIVGLKSNPRCKAIVAFSAKLDGPAKEIVDKWIINGKPASQYIDAVFVRNHLVLGKKARLTETAGNEIRTKTGGETLFAMIPSKDLRIFDETLEHVILVDDNPARVVQPQLLRPQPKFDADKYHEAVKAGNKVLVEHFENLLGGALNEIVDSAAAATELQIPFTQAFLPYSYGGERIYRNFLRTKSSEEAKRLTRLNPELQEAVFVREAGK